MNEQIRELIKQVGGISYDDDNKAMTPMLVGKQVEKLAELIIGECLNKIENEAAQYAEPVWAFELVNDIKEHFGVE
jgi:hypothetical protein